ncbi:MAG: hypothetical protein ABR956_06540 [Terracidiphilus sp.]
MRSNPATTPAAGTRAAPLGSSIPGVLSTPASSANPATPPTQAKINALKTPAGKPSDEDIRAAKAQGLVWVDLDANVYHTPGDQQYGTTTNGRFMDADDAKAVGAQLAPN